MGASVGGSEEAPMKALRVAAIGLVGFVVLALALDLYVGLRQPEVGGRECVLRTTDEAGNVHETRLALIEDHGTLWVQSGHHFRGWYERVLENPEVEVVLDGEAHPFRAVPLDTPEARAHVIRLLKQRAGPVRFYAIRTLLLFAEIKPVRLDPR
jgi:hypothetical protein